MSQQSKQPVSNGQLCEFKPDFNLRPIPLTSQSTLMETHQFYAQFSKFIKSSNSVPDGIIYAQAAVTMDIFWLTEMKNRSFDKDTNLNDFICLIKDVTLSKISLDTRRATMFDYKKQDTKAVKFACDACQYYLYCAPVINIFTDCSALEVMFNKPLGEIKN